MHPKITLIDGVAQHQRTPDTFWVPSDADKAAVKPGDHVKLGFTDGVHRERMWVKVTSPGIGLIDNDPAFLPIEYGDTVAFEPRHILNILPA